MRRLYYDIETSLCKGVFFRPGYNQTINPSQILAYGKIICISYAVNDGDVKHVHWGNNKQCDKKLLETFIKELNKADEIIAHNGDKFDIRWIRARAAYHNLEVRPDYRTIDTYKQSKRLFNLPSHKLSEVAKYFGLTNKLDPGGLQTWIDIVIHKDKEALDRMIHYCDGDIITLREVYKKIQNYAKPTMHYGVLKGGEKFSCPSCGSNHIHYNKSYTTAAGTIKHYVRCVKCRQPFQINNKTYMDYLKFKMIN